MKFILLTIIAGAIALAGQTQGRSEGRGKSNHKAEKPHFDKSYEEEVASKKGRQKAGKNSRYDSDYSMANQGKPAQGVPAKVMDSFQELFPNARQVSWTKKRGYWTAYFQTGVFNQDRAVTFHANGKRVNESRGMFGNRND